MVVADTEGGPEVIRVDPDGDVYRVRHEFDGPTALSTTVILAVESVTERSMAEMPLYEVIDPECLDGLFQPIGGHREGMRGHVEFPYGGYLVRVDADGEILIGPLDPS
ncbi:HalOD1 output domain-containing protein [Natronorarus salvus]|uniref:HalOD1 output domain-containing protein n=1 Tax=Natronorarus salvus TaxID=3117733 RepID=UPI002F267B10